MRHSLSAFSSFDGRRKTIIGYRGIVKGNVVIFEEGIRLPDGTEVEVTLVGEPLQGSPGALLRVWGPNVPEEGWDAVEQAVEELDRADQEYERNKPHA